MEKEFIGRTVKEDGEPKHIKFKLKELDRIRNYTYLYGNNFSANLEYEDMAMWEEIDKVARKYPNYIALEYFDKKITYNELMDSIVNCAKMFKNYGAKKGDRVMIAMANTPEAVISFYGANMAGVIPAMIHPKSSKYFIEGALKKTKSKFVVGLNNCLSNIEEIIKENSNIDNDLEYVFCVSPKDSMNSPMLKMGYQLTKTKGIKKVSDDRFISFHQAMNKSTNYKGDYVADIKGKDRSAIIFSGGTTSDPKAILHRNNGFNTLSKESFTMCDCLSAGDKMLLVIPLFHGFGLEIGVHATLINGMHIILEPEPNIDRIVKIFKYKKPQLFMAVPKLLKKMIDSRKFDNIDYRKVKMFISGGASLSKALKDEWDALLHDNGSKASIREGYGSAQMIAGTCINPKNNPKAGSIGIPLPDIYYKVVEPGTDCELKSGQVGELCVCCESLMEGYLKEPSSNSDDLQIDKELTDEDLKIHSDGNKWLHTHDLVKQTDDGFYEWVQRADFIISNKEGNLINPKDIEEVLEKQEDVKSAAVFGMNDEQTDDKNLEVVACVALNGEFHQEDAVRSIYSNLLCNLAKFQMPQQLILVKDIPETLVGKPNVRAIKSAMADDSLHSKVYKLTKEGYKLY